MFKEEKATITIGIVTLHLPDHNSSSFMIAMSMGEEFGVETNYDALKVLRQELRQKYPDVYKYIKTDAEGGCVFIHASSKRGEEILIVARTINDIAIEPYFQTIDEGTYQEAIKIVQAWKCPTPQKWKIGDVFYIPLSDGTFAFGQVLWGDRNNINCALFERKGSVIPLVQDILESNVLSVIEIDPMSINSFEWIVIGNAPVFIKAEEVPFRHRGAGKVGSESHSSGILTGLAEAYYGLIPWNSYLELDDLLLPGVERPLAALILTEQELNEYYRSKG